MNESISLCRYDMVECYTIIITFSLYDSRPVCHPSINPSRLQQHLLMPHRLSNKNISLLIISFYWTVISIALPKFVILMIQ